MICETSITPELYAELKDSEAIVVREYERADGTRFARVIGAGATGEMEELASTPGLLIVPPGLTYLGDMVVPVSELLPPDETPESEGENES